MSLIYGIILLTYFCCVFSNISTKTATHPQGWRKLYGGDNMRKKKQQFYFVKRFAGFFLALTLCFSLFQTFAEATCQLSNMNSVTLTADAAVFCQ